MNRNISIIGAPLALGQTHRGVALGPDAIRYSGLTDILKSFGYTIKDLGNLNVEQPPSNTSENRQHNLKYLTEIVQMNERLAEQVYGEKNIGQFPLILGGDHSLAIGSLAGVTKNQQDLGVIWFDAHGDLNTHLTSPSGNIHGMPLAASLGYGHEKLINIAGFTPKIKPENLVIIGARDLDPGEKALIKELNIRTYGMHDIDQMGMKEVIQEMINYLQDTTTEIHLSLDIDGLDPAETPGVGTPVAGGMTFRESNLAMAMLSETGLVTSCDIVEVNPLLDYKNQTADIAVRLASTLFGNY